MHDDIANPVEAPAVEPAAAAPALPPEPETPKLADTIVGSSLKTLIEQAEAQEKLADAPHPEPVAETPAPIPEPVAEAPAVEAAADSIHEHDTPVEGTPLERPVAEEPATEPAPAKKKRTKAKPAEEPAEAAAAEPAAEAPATPPAPAAPTRNWYVVKVQSGREDTIRRDIERKVKIQGLEEFFGRIEVPFEEIVEKKKVKAKVKDKKTGEEDVVYQEKNVTKKRKKFPGYIFAEVDFNDRILYLFRETSGVGDFVGATMTRAPNPMSEHEVTSMLTGVAVKGGPKAGKVKVKLDYEKGDKVKIRDGAFSGMEGEVKHISEAKDATETPKVKVEVKIFGRGVEVELDYWQVDKA